MIQVIEPANAIDVATYRAHVDTLARNMQTPRDGQNPAERACALYRPSAPSEVSWRWASFVMLGLAIGFGIGVFFGAFKG